MRETAPDLSISTEKLCYIIAKSRSGKFLSLMNRM